MKIFIDWKGITTEEDFYQQLLPQLKAPSWHGHNLDALNDSIVTGNINGVEPPYCIINTGVTDINPALQPFYKNVNDILKSAKANDRTVRVFEE